MPAPRFSLRTTLVLLTAGALFFALTGFGESGGAWAVAIAAGMASVLLCLCIHAAFYWLFIALSRVMGVEVVIARTSRGALTPFAAPRQDSIGLLPGEEPLGAVGTTKGDDVSQTFVRGDS